MKSPEATASESMDTITLNENDTNSKESTQETANKEDLLNQLKQYSDFTQPTLDWIGAVYYQSN